MVNSTSSVAESVNSAVSVPVEMIAGQTVESVKDTLEQLGLDLGKALKSKADAERSVAQCDTALFDWVKGLEYVEFQLVKRHVVLGLVDSGCSDSTNGAEQMWDKAINRLGTSFEFKRPKSESKDAVRKAEAKAKLEEEFASKSDADLESTLDSLLSIKDMKSINQAKVVAKEIARRNAPEIEKNKAIADMRVKKIIELSKALAKIADESALDKLDMALSCLL